jgi:hypothetical protein
VKGFGNVGVCGEDDDGRSRPQLHQAGENLEPVFGPQLQVEENRIEAVGFGGLDRLGGVRSFARSMARGLDRDAGRLANRWLIVDY